MKEKPTSLKLGFSNELIAKYLRHPTIKGLATNILNASPTAVTRSTIINNIPDKAPNIANAPALLALELSP